MKISAHHNSPPVVPEVARSLANSCMIVLAQLCDHLADAALHQLRAGDDHLQNIQCMKFTMITVVR